MATSKVKPLQSAKGLSELKKSGEVVEWGGQKSVRTFHIFVNETSEPVELFWFHDKGESVYGTIEPGSNLYVGTYTFNSWKVKSKATGNMLGVHCGQSATVTVRPSGCSIQFNAATADADDKDATSMDTPKGNFSIRAHAMGMPVWAFESVEQAAVERAVHVVSRMMEGCPAAIREAMLANKSAIAVFGRDHVVSDVPPHSFMRHNTDRNLDRTCRGLGGTPTVPVTSCAEENLLMDSDKLYSCQSILVHEFGHAVQNLGMDFTLRAAVQAAYKAALQEARYPADCYMISNEQEYWATGTEAWFESTIRADVNGGVNSRAAAHRIDPKLASLLSMVYGDGEWRYHHDCPQPLSFTCQPAPHKAQQQSQPVATSSPASSEPATSQASSPGQPPQDMSDTTTTTTTTPASGHVLQPLHVAPPEACVAAEAATTTTTTPAPGVQAYVTLQPQPGGDGGGGTQPTAVPPTAVVGSTGGSSTKPGSRAALGVLAAIKVGPAITKTTKLQSRASAPPNIIALTTTASAPTQDVTMCAPEPQNHSPLQHGPASDQPGLQGCQKSGDGEAGAPWGRIRYKWPDSLTTLCPGARMYPSSEPAGPWSTSCGSPCGGGPPDSPGSLMHVSPKAPQAEQDYSAEVISILSGGAYHGPADVAAVAGIQPAAPTPAPNNLGILNAFSACMAGRHDKVKNSV